VFGRIIGVVLAVLVIAAIGIGCGSSSDDSTDGGGDGTAANGETSGGGSDGAGAAPVTVSSKSIPKNKYVKEGDAICVAVPTEYQQYLGELPKKQQENKQISVPKAAIPPLEKATKDLAELGAPNGDQAKAEEIVAALEAAIEGLEEEPKGELSGPKSSFAEFNKLTNAMGFKSCSTL